MESSVGSGAVGNCPPAAQPLDCSKGLWVLWIHNLLVVILELYHPRSWVLPQFSAANHGSSWVSWEKNKTLQRILWQLGSMWHGQNNKILSIGLPQILQYSSTISLQWTVKNEYEHPSTRVHYTPVSSKFCSSRIPQGDWFSIYQVTQVLPFHFWQVHHLHPYSPLS